MTARSVIIAALLVLLRPAQSAITQDDGHQVSFDDVVAAANSNKSFEEAIAEQLNSRGRRLETSSVLLYIGSAACPDRDASGNFISPIQGSGWVESDNTWNGWPTDTNPSTSYSYDDTFLTLGWEMVCNDGTDIWANAGFFTTRTVADCSLCWIHWHGYDVQGVDTCNVTWVGFGEQITFATAPYGHAGNGQGNVTFTTSCPAQRPPRPPRSRHPHRHHSCHQSYRRRPHLHPYYLANPAPLKSSTQGIICTIKSLK